MRRQLWRNSGYISSCCYVHPIPGWVARKTVELYFSTSAKQHRCSAKAETDAEMCSVNQLVMVTWGNNVGSGRRGSVLACGVRGRILKHETIEGFVKIIQRRYSLKHVTYMCPSFAGRERKDPVLATTYSDEWVRHYKEQDYGMIDPTITIGARSSLPVDIATLPLTSKKAKTSFRGGGRRGNRETGSCDPPAGADKWPLGTYGCHVR